MRTPRTTQCNTLT